MIFNSMVGNVGVDSEEVNLVRHTFIPLIILLIAGSIFIMTCDVSGRIMNCDVSSKLYGKYKSRIWT